MKTKFKTQRKGAVLMTVVVVSMMMVVIVGAAISLVYHTNYRTNKEYRLKQAYFAASSVLESFVAETTSYTQAAGSDVGEIADAIDKLQQVADGKPAKVTINKVTRGGGIGDAIEEDNPRWGNVEVTLSVEKVGGSDSSLKAISTATYLGQEKTVVAYLAIKPLNKKKSVLNALEMMNANGGKDYNKIRVYGNTSAPDIQTHNDNVVYFFTSNEDTFYGDMSIYGSAVLQVGMNMNANPYYYDKVYSSEDEVRLDELYTPGGVLRVSRTLYFQTDSPLVQTTLIKNSAMNESVNGDNKNYYNFIEAREALVMGAVGARIGSVGSSGSIADSDAKMVDVYTSLLYMGDINQKPELVDWCASTATSPATFKSKFTRMSDGRNQKIYGNIYTFGPDTSSDTTPFNGDIYLENNGCEIRGDIYCDGDFYIRDLNTLSTITEGNVYFSTGGSFRNWSSGAAYTAEECEAKLGSHGTVKYNYDWKNNIPRADRPLSLENTITPYYYYPEHLLLEPSISTISNTYKSLYGTGANTLNGTGIDDSIRRPTYSLSGSSYVLDPNGDYIQDDDGLYIDVKTKYRYQSWDGQYAVDQWTDEPYLKKSDGTYVRDLGQFTYYAKGISSMKTERSGNKVQYWGYEYAGGTEIRGKYTITDGSYEYKYKDKTGVEKTEILVPKDFDNGGRQLEYVVTESCIWDKTFGMINNVKGNILIDLDHAKKNADGNYDIVIILDPKVTMTNSECPKILVKNFEHGPDSDDPRFVYFVSDSGIGTVNNEYGADRITPSTYDKTTFKKADYNYADNTAKIVLMNLVDYCHSNLQDNANSLDPTGRELGAPVYDVGSGGIFLLMTEGCRINFGQDSILQCNIFMPKGTFRFANDGKKMNVEPVATVWGKGPITVNIIGSLSCEEYDSSANENTIIYQPASNKSMLAFVHGVEDEAATESFQLVRYASA